MEISQLVRARGQRWRVADVRAYESCQLLILNPETPATDRASRRLLIPFDDVLSVERVDRPRQVSRTRWRRACRALIAADLPPGSLSAALRARFDLLAYQLEPAMAILRGQATRVLLADEVGLGKTIQASLVLAELLMRGRVERVLILAPAGLRDQWAAELGRRFDIQATVADAVGLRQLARMLPLDVNPWETAAIAIASIDYVKRPEVLPAIAACRWDVLVVDEAHAAVGDSERHQAVRLLASRASYALLLTATPHSGDPRTFDALCDIGLAGPDDRLLVFRRSRLDVHGGPPRHTRVLRLRSTSDERRMFDALARYRDAVRTEHGARALTLSVLDKRAFSSAWSLAASVERRLRELHALGSSADEANQLRLPFDVDGEMDAEDAPPEWPTDVALSDAEAEKRLLLDVAEAARAAEGHESKIRMLQRLLRRLTESVLVFTEYRDTAVHLSGCLGGAPILHGGLDRHERRAVIESFTRGGHRVLVATDAGGQGLNLHHRCRLVVNLELPWNPMRLEQRIGRVDRIGQTRRVHAVHLVGRDTGELDVMTRLEQRVAAASGSIAVADPIGNRRRFREARPEHANARVVVPEAQAEAARAASARRMIVPGDEATLAALDAGRWWVVSARPKTRARLRGHRISVYRVRVPNAAGGVAASHLIGVASSSREAAPGDVGDLLRTAVDDWLNAVAAIEHAFWRIRIEREEAILASTDPESRLVYQPGLFDRRAERLHSADRASRQALQGLLRARLSDVQRQAAFRSHVVDLMLVLQ